MSKIIDLSNDEVEPINLLHYDFIKVSTKIGVIKTLWQQLRKGLDRDQWVPHFMRHAGGEIGPKSGAIDQFLFLSERFFRRHILDDGDGAQGIVIMNQPTRLHRKRATCDWVNPLLRR